MKIKHDITAATTTTTNGIRNNRNIDGNYNNKIIILTFGDIHKSQYTIGKPILDRYGFKSSFFVTCGFVSDINNKNAENNNNNELPRMTWNDILSLQQDGQDIESKGMTHRDLNLLALQMI